MTDASIPLALDGYTPLPAGKLASIVTFLEMRAPPRPLREPEGDGFTLRRVTRADPGWYRGLFRRIGEDWLWISRLKLTDDALAAILHDPFYELHILGRGDATDLGLLELDFRAAPEVELAFLGLVPGLVGTGAGRFLMNRANEAVWTRGTERFFVHTCSFDHPAAIGFYRKAGFTACGRAVEVLDDPRLTGDLPLTAAPQVPVI